MFRKAPTTFYYSY